MAYVRTIETSPTKNSKPVPSYQVRWQEPARDETGRPIPSARLDPTARRSRSTSKRRSVPRKLRRSDATN